jgi:hypothetical protein
MTNETKIYLETVTLCSDLSQRLTKGVGALHYVVRRLRSALAQISALG